MKKNGEQHVCCTDDCVISTSYVTMLQSHTRTVVRECCKDDDQCQWERPKFDTPPQLNPLTDRHQNLPT